MSNIPLEYLMVNSQDLDSDVSSNLETSRDQPDSRLFDEVMLRTGRDTLPEELSGGGPSMGVKVHPLELDDSEDSDGGGDDKLD
jgi:hypothetical protein